MLKKQASAMRIVFDHILRASGAARAYVGKSAGHSASYTANSIASLRTAGSAILTAFVLVACGQRGPLYLPTIPPLPPSPTAHSAAAAAGSSISGAGAANSASDAAEPSDANDVNDHTAIPGTAASNAIGNGSTTGNTASGSK